MEEKKTTQRYTMDDIPAAAQVLKRGGLVAVPTETVNGLAAPALGDAAGGAIHGV